MLARNFALRKSSRTGKLYVVGVALVNHVAPHPLHEVCDRRQRQRNYGQYPHQRGRVDKAERSRQSYGSAYRLEHEYIRTRGHRHNEYDIYRAYLVNHTAFTARHNNAKRNAEAVGNYYRNNAYYERISHARHAVEIGGYDGIVVLEAHLRIFAAGSKRARGIGCRMKVVGGVCCVARGINNRRRNYVALFVGHRVPHVDVFVYRIRGAEPQRYNILMNKGELVVEVQQIFMPGAVAHYCWRKLFAAVDGVVPCK